MPNLSVDPPIGTWRLVKQALSSLRRRGIGGTVKRTAREISVPTTGLGRFLNVVAVGITDVVSAPARLLLRVSGGWAVSADTLHAFYDLRVEPYSFDILWFLAGADLERRRRKLKHVHVVIVLDGSDRDGAGEADVTAQLGDQERQWRVKSILVDSASLLPACSGLTLCTGRAQARFLARAAAHVYPHGYRVAFPVAHNPKDVVEAGKEGAPVAVLKSPDQARAYVGQWIADRFEGRRPVSITLRESSLSEPRNSNIQAWIQFAQRIQCRGYAPIFVRDTEAALRPANPVFDGQILFHEGPWNPLLRMALYESCFLNLGVNNGPCAMGWLNDAVRYLTFKMQVPGLPATSDAAFRVRGMEPGESLPFAGPAQKWVWEDDELDVISREFDLACREIGELDARSRAEGRDRCV